MLITGGGSGLGREWARAFHDLGNRVIIAGRRLDALRETADGRTNMTCLTFDATDPDSINDLARKAVEVAPDLNVVFNNAGVMLTEDLVSPQPGLTNALRMVETNLLGPMRLTAALMSHLQGKSGATIINVSSGLAFVPLAITPTYSATKAAIHSWTVSLRWQLRDTGIEVIEVAPPGVQTDLMPGQADNPHMMPLKDFIDETMALFSRQPADPEVCVGRVGFLRHAEANGTFDATLAALNASH